MLPDELSALRQQSLCVTITVPLQEAGGLDKKAALLTIDKVIRKAGDLLRKMHPEEAAPLLTVLQTLAESFARHYDFTAEGLGFYVSTGYSKLVKFFFPVQEKIHIADAFAIRELLYLEHYSINYLVLQVNGKTAQCYRGHLNILEEIKDNVFPRYFHDDYEYSKPAKTSSYAGQEGLKGFERDKTVTEANRLKSFYRETDHLLNTYLGKLPLVVAGPKKDLSLLQEVSRHQKNIIITINGNYANGTIKTLEERVWPEVRCWIDEKQYTTTLNLIEEEGQHVIDGIRNIWAAAMEGRGYRLIVERDYSYPAFLDDKTGKLHFKAPQTTHHMMIDAVDEVLKLIVEKGGEVLFVKNGTLNTHGHICLITRY